MKRAAPAEESGGGSGNNMNAINAKVDPIPRPIKTQSVTLTFRQRTWEEIGPGELKYLPLCQTPYYMLDEANKNLIREYKKLWSTAIYHQPKARITNLIMLQDDLVNQGGTPMETTAFTQVCYMLKMTPTHQQQYFKLADITDCKKGTALEMVYDLSDVTCGTDYSQLIKIGNYKDFERLAILPAKPDKFAGYQLYNDIRIINDGVHSNIKDTFFSPSLLVKNNTFGIYSANMQPVDPPVIDTLKQVTWLRNLDKISFHKVGDTIEIPIVTNIDDKPLLNNDSNDLLSREAYLFDTENTYLYNKEFLWPSPHRPYFSRKDNLSEMMTNIESKNLKQLEHCFFTMPPIRKANGALLKQRCSFFLEQEFSITLNFPDSAWGEESGKEMLLSQKDAIVTRPVIYGSLRTGRKDEGAICKEGEFTCTGEKCPFDNSFVSLIELMVDAQFEFSFLNAIPGQEEYKYVATKPTKLTNDIILSEEFKTAWKKWHDKTTTGAFYIDLKTKAHIDLVNRHGQTLTQEAVSLTDNVAVVRWYYFDKMKEDFGIKCKKESGPQGKKHAPDVMHTGYLPSGRESKIFYV